VMLGVSPPLLYAEFWERGFQGHLLDLSLDGSANFVVQAAFAAMTEAAQVTLCGHVSALQRAGSRQPVLVSVLTLSSLVRISRHASSSELNLLGPSPA